KGWKYFTKKPLFGYGINNFRTLFGRETGLYTYSHFTPVELVIGFGFIGVILYYSIYWILIKRLIKMFRRSKSSLFYFLFAVILSLIIIGFYMQIYFDPTVHFMIVVSLCFIKLFPLNSSYINKSIQNR